MLPQTTRWASFAFLALGCLLFAAAGHAQKSRPTEVLTFSIPGEATVLEFDSPDFVTVRNERNQDGSVDFSAVNKEARMDLGIHLRHSPALATPAGCRESLAQQAKKESGPITDFHFSEIEGLPSVEYLLPADHGTLRDEKIVVVCLTRENDYAIIRLAITGFQPADQKQFSEILKKVRFSRAAGVIQPAPDSQSAAPHADENSLVAQGQSLFKIYKCHECHGPQGEGTDDAPDLIGTRLNADQIAGFLQKPSAHARSVGMPNLPADSPDLQPLVAFVLSLKRPTPPK